MSAPSRTTRKAIASKARPSHMIRTRSRGKSTTSSALHGRPMRRRRRRVGRTGRFRSSSSACRGRARPCSNRSSTSMTTSKRSENYPISGRILRSALELETRRRPIEVPEFIEQLTDEQKAVLGEEYMRRARLHLRSDARYFVDKMPTNWSDVMFIREILPHARSSKSGAMGWIAASPTTSIIFRALTPRLSIFTTWAAATWIMCG